MLIKIHGDSKLEGFFQMNIFSCPEMEKYEDQKKNEEKSEK